MSQEDAIKVVPDEVRSALHYFDLVFTDNDYGNQKMIFSFINDKDDNFCVLYADFLKDSFKFNISCQHDNIFYSQLLISLLDKYVNSYEAKFTTMYKENDALVYRFRILVNNRLISVQIDSNNDLEKLMDYYNERVLLNHSNDFKIGGGRK